MAGESASVVLKHPVFGEIDLSNPEQKDTVKLVGLYNELVRQTHAELVDRHHKHGLTESKRLTTYEGGYESTEIILELKEVFRDGKKYYGYLGLSSGKEVFVQESGGCQMNVGNGEISRLVESASENQQALEEVIKEIQTGFV